MSEPILNFVACPWCTSGNAADMRHWGKCPGAAERNRKAKDAVAEMFAALDAPVATATADQLRRKLLECEEALRTTEARAEKAERERDALQAMVLRSKVNHPFKSERTRRCDDCGEYESAHIQPMTAVTEDGRMWRLTPHGSWLTKRNPDGSLHCNHSDRDHCRVQGHETEITYRLVPIEEVDR